MTPDAQRCAVHQQRPAFARCMSCTKMLCRECATEWDGIWHCTACLGARRTVTVAQRPALRWLGVLMTTAVFAFLTTRVLLWVGAVAARLFS